MRKLDMFAKILFAVLKTAVLLPWTALVVLIGIACLPLVVALAFAWSDDFEDLFDNIGDFYFDHVCRVSGLESTLDTWLWVFRKV